MVASGTASAVERDSIDLYLSRIDGALRDRDRYERRKTERIERIKRGLSADADAGRRFAVYGELFGEYQSFCFDSALVYAGKFATLAETEGDRERIAASKLMLANANNSAGLFLEAMDALDSVDSTVISGNIKVGLYSGYSKLYLDMALSVRNFPYEERYLERSADYSRKIMELTTDSAIRRLQQINIYRCRKKYDAAIRETLRFFASEPADDRSVILCKGALGMFYLAEGDTLKGIDYLSQTVAGDVQYAVKESSALADLSNIAYRYGFVDRAYTYITLAMNDAIFFNSRHRKVESGEILPIVESSRFELMAAQRRKLYIALACVALLSLCLAVASYFILRQMRQVKLSRLVIEKKNGDLRDSHRKLVEGNKVKEEYIGYFLSLNASYLDEIDRFKLLVGRKLAARQYGELSQLLKQENSKHKKEAKFATFDRLFLKLFPDFVPCFNELFEPDARVEIPLPDVLTPELRIFALIRLGVADSEEIARFLNYSVNTINTYKTRVKNRSNVPNAEFEGRIMEIESFRSELV